MRNDLINASRTKLREVVELGQSQGLWTVQDAQHDGIGDDWSFVTVVTPEGLTFSLRGGSWGREGAIGCTVCGIAGPHGVRVGPRDLPSDLRGGSEANASHTRTAAAILADFCRRVIQRPEAVAQATAIRDLLAERLKDRETLRGHMAALESIGYTFDRVGDAESYSASGYLPGGHEAYPYRVTVNRTGAVTFETSCSVEAFPGVLASLR